MKSILVLSALFLSVSSFAKSDKGNGGFVIQCPGSELLVLDYYEATLPTLSGKPELLLLDSASNLEKSKVILDNRMAGLPNFHQTVLSKFQDTLDLNKWILVNLAPADDDTNIVYQSCDKPTRAAFRQDGIVYLQEGMQNKLSSGQLFVLGLHEWLYESSKFSSSEKTRHVIREMLKSPAQFNQARFQKGIESLLANWTPLIFKTNITMSDAETSRLDQECQSRGAAFATYYKGTSSTRSGCGGIGCITYYVNELTCAKLVNQN